MICWLVKQMLGGKPLFLFSLSLAQRVLNDAKLI